MACNRHKKREGGEVVPVFHGLAAEVSGILGRMKNIESLKCGSVRKYHGNRKVRLEPWYRHVEIARAVIYVCDKEYGECEMIINTYHPGPILRLLRRELERNGISVSCVATGQQVKAAA